MPSARRIIDANANRAREAARVLEDAARFIACDAELAARCKSVRHELTEAVAGIAGLGAERDAAGDVGRTIEAAAEYERRSELDVVTAASRRLGEALRSIEEHVKTIDPAVARIVERLRYRGYDVERDLVAAVRGRRRQWRLCVLLTESLCRRPWDEVAESAIRGGADCLQLREKTLPDGALLERARALVALARGRADVVVNDRPDVALLAGADGVHLGRGDLPCAAARRIVGRGLLIGVSTSSLDEAQRALDGGADVCGVGPMYPSTTVHKEAIAGPAYLAEYVAWGGLPHLAIGGITAERMPELVAAGARGVAVCGAVCGADDPEAAARAIASRITSSGRSEARR